MRRVYKNGEWWIVCPTDRPYTPPSDLMSRSVLGSKLHNRLAEYRCAAGLSPEQLADLANRSASTIVAIESGRCVPSTLCAAELCWILGVSIDDVFGLELRDPDHMDPADYDF